MHKFQLHPCIMMALWMGLVAIQMESEYPDIDNKVLPQLQLPIQQQQCLGWDQLYQGQPLVTWANANNQIHPNMVVSGMQVMVTLTKLIWTYILAFVLLVSEKAIL